MNGRIRASDIDQDVCVTQKNPAASVPARFRACDRFGRKVRTGAGALGQRYFTRWRSPPAIPFAARICPVSSTLTAAQLRAWALEEGFDRAGIARLTPSEHGEAFEEWLARGDHAEMGYLERRTQMRLDPREILAEARSVLCVALQYHPLAGQEAPAGDLWPGVARYARGEDYHRLMDRRLRRLASRVEAVLPSSDSKIYVDTGPVLERELAARAGLGSVGKNTNLLDAELGSWFLLGELFLTLDLQPDIPGSDLCGTCSLCLDACPTGALPEPYRLDSRLCISYWTIEHRGAIPQAMRPLLGEWVFGCDICQEVCPINTDPRLADHAELLLPDDRASLDLAGLLDLEVEGYVEIFRRSPMKRPKLAGLQRNAAVAMGNTAREKYTDPLIRSLDGGESLVRQHAAWALGRIGDEKGLAALRSALVCETDPAVRAEIQQALRDAG